jgi:hypothetical protein
MLPTLDNTDCMPPTPLTQALLDHVLLDDLEDLVLLEHLSGDVEGQVLRVDNTLQK